MGNPAQTILPRWRGFNLLEMFTTHSDGNFKEDDFRWIADWGFNFVRIPACYTLWIVGEDVYQLSEPMFEKIDRVIQYGQKYGIHVCFNFHRAPGFSVNRERKEPFSLWKDQEAVDAFCFHWEAFAKRYKDIPSTQLSFNLVNEPADISEKTMTRADHERVMRSAVTAIHRIDPNRLIILDGLRYARVTLPELVDLASSDAVAQSCRAYEPHGVSHYKASWVGGEKWSEPTWPGKMEDGIFWDRKRLEDFYQPWIDLARQGVGVHCGEGGAFCYTPHPVVLSWLRDVLEILTPENIGLALWNFRGPFGVLDSNRQDVIYEDWHSHKLDRSLLQLLQSF